MNEITINDSCIVCEKPSKLVLCNECVERCREKKWQESEGVVVEMIVESRECIPASDHDMLKLRGPMLAEIPIIEAMVDCTCRFQVDDRIAVRLTRIQDGG